MEAEWHIYAWVNYTVIGSDNGWKTIWSPQTYFPILAPLRLCENAFYDLSCTLSVEYGEKYIKCISYAFWTLESFEHILSTNVLNMWLQRCSSRKKIIDLKALKCIYLTLFNIHAERELKELSGNGISLWLCANMWHPQCFSTGDTTVMP